MSNVVITTCILKGVDTDLSHVIHMAEICVCRLENIGPGILNLQAIATVYMIYIQQQFNYLINNYLILVFVLKHFQWNKQYGSLAQNS